MKPVTATAAALLSLVSILQLCRVLFHIQVTIADDVIPMWVSVVAFLVAGGLAIGLWRDARAGR